jgi:hypothetical protein
VITVIEVKKAKLNKNAGKAPMSLKALLAFVLFSFISFAANGESDTVLRGSPPRDSSRVISVQPTHDPKVQTTRGTGPSGPESGVTGVWTADNVGFPPWTLALKAEGGKLDGTVMQGAKDSSGSSTTLTMPVEIYDGEINGTTITFKCQDPGHNRTITFTGTVNGDEIVFTRKVVVKPGGYPGGKGIFGASGVSQFNARRVVSSAAAFGQPQAQRQLPAPAPSIQPEHREPQTERILDFVSDAQLQGDGGLEVTETISFRVLGTQIRHGINRDFPTDYQGRWGSRSTTGFVVEDVRLDGEFVPMEPSRLPNGVRVRIGDPGRLVPPGNHTYTIRYLTWWQVNFGQDTDGLDWNVTGNGWSWPIDRAELRLHGPEGLIWNSVRLFTGPPGSRAEDAQIITQTPGFLDVVTTRPLSLYEGLTVAATFPKGVVQQPSQLAVAAHWVGDNQALAASFLGVVGIGFYVGWLFLYGAARPPAVIIPQFAPPGDFSPAMVGYLEDKRLSNRDFSAGIVGLAVARRLKLIHGDGIYRLVRQQSGQPVTELEAQFEGALFRGGDELSVSATNCFLIGFARTTLNNLLRRAVMPALLHKAPGNGWPAVALAAATIVLTAAALVVEFGTISKPLGFGIGFAVAGALVVLLALAGNDNRWRDSWLGRCFAAAIGLLFLFVGLLVANTVSLSLFFIALFVAVTVALTAASFSLLTVPTAEGWKCRDQIEGLKLFLSVAEGDRLRVLNPPDFTPALYEKLLPYAIALGVEMVWSRRFAAALAASQIDYQPDWYDGSHPWNRSDITEFSSDLGGSLSAAIAAASTPPSSSDGSSGSGGGGSGGGGSGW